MATHSYKQWSGMGELLGAAASELEEMDEDLARLVWKAWHEIGERTVAALEREKKAYERERAAQ